MFEAGLRAVADTALDGIMLIDEGGGVMLFNPACEQMFGYAASEIIGSNIDRLMPGLFDEGPDQWPGVRRMMGIGREVQGRRKSGDAFPIELSVGEARKNDQETFFVGILRDITERRRADEQREELIEELAASNEERGHFAHAASHDLREQLRMISSFCGLLSNDYGERLDDRGREYLTLVMSAAAQMKDLLDDLVDYARLGADAERRTWFESGETLDQVVEILAEAIRETGAVITRERLPRVYGNQIRFERLLQNLVGNAMKYVPPGATPNIHVSADRAGEVYRFKVADNGIGIEPRHFDQIFEPFKRLHSRSDYSGTGLGLAICRKIVQGFGGEIMVWSAPGVGSTFSFTIPASQRQ
jgi:two-component system sensor kinase FixL